MNLHIPSETGTIESLIVHTPGREVSLVDPEKREKLLFDDIIFEQDARNEHLRMIEIIKSELKDSSRVFEICDLASETLSITEARRFFLETLAESLPEINFRFLIGDLMDLETNSLLEFIVTGTSDTLPGISMDPAPNLLFTRDLAAVVNDQIIVSRPARKARIREFLLMETMVRHHALFQGARERMITVGRQDSVEGGDIIIASPEVVLIGMSERTTFSGLVEITECLLEGRISHVVAVDIPKQRSSMHLDTIFTFASPHECIVFPPAIVERSGNISVFSTQGGSMVVHRKHNLHATLQELLDRPLTFIPCGGRQITDQIREQWTDGANVFALSPGIILGYERNVKTFDELAAHGYRVLDQNEYLKLKKNSKGTFPIDEKIAISFEGKELCRGRGGARCMTLPLIRQGPP